MYINIHVVFILLLITLMGGFLGCFIDRDKGWILGFVLGAIAAVGLIMKVQSAEIHSWQYDDAREAIAGDCRLADIGTSILADRVITASEYWRLEDRQDELRITDARSRINGETIRQCPSRD